MKTFLYLYFVAVIAVLEVIIWNALHRAGLPVQILFLVVSASTGAFLIFRKKAATEK